VVFRLDPSHRLPFEWRNIAEVSRSPGVYVIYDLAGPIYAGRSRVDIHRRLQSHFNGTGNRNLALTRRIGASSSLTFTYCLLPTTEQVDAERILIAALGVAKYANLRRERLYEDDL
jgi:predicted GIY-YIG superfamily endonuclease